MKSVPSSSLFKIKNGVGAVHWLLAIALSGIVLFGCLQPFDFHLPSSESIVTVIEKELSSDRERIHLVDFAENVILFLVITFAWGVCFLARNSYLKGLFLTSVLCLFLSCFFECSQLLVESRTFASLDILANAFGIILAHPLLLRFGKSVSLDNLGERSHPELLFYLYLFILSVYSFFPFDFTIHPVEIGRSFKQGKLLLVPFADFDITDNNFEYLLKNVLLYVPAGILSGLLRKPFLAFFCVAYIEFIQIFLLSRYTTTGDLICGAIGALVGLYVCRTMLLPEESKS